MLLEPAHRLLDRDRDRGLGQARARAPRVRCSRTGSRCAVRTPSSGTRTRPATSVAACARPSATAIRQPHARHLASRDRGQRLEQLAHHEVRDAEDVALAASGRADTRASGPRRRRRRRRRSCPVSTYAGIRPARKSRISAPVGVGLTSPQPIGNVGLTITASRPRSHLVADELLGGELALLVGARRSRPACWRLVGDDAASHPADRRDARRVNEPCAGAASRIDDIASATDVDRVAARRDSAKNE